MDKQKKKKNLSTFKVSLRYLVLVFALLFGRNDHPEAPRPGRVFLALDYPGFPHLSESRKGTLPLCLAERHLFMDIVHARERLFGQGQLLQVGENFRLPAGLPCPGRSDFLPYHFLNLFLAFHVHQSPVSRILV